MLDKIASMHKSKWEKSSIPRISAKDKQRGIYFSCPDVVAILNNIDEHAKYMTSTVNHMSKVVSQLPETLRLGQDMAGADRLLADADRASRQLRMAGNAADRLGAVVRERVRADPALAAAADKISSRNKDGGKGRFVAVVTSSVLCAFAAVFLYRYRK